METILSPSAQSLVTQLTDDLLHAGPVPTSTKNERGNSRVHKNARPNDVPSQGVGWEISDREVMT